VSSAPFDPLRVLQVLQQHRVRFVVVGGLAARVWGSPTVTNDLDICYARDPSNLAALAEALTLLGARLRGVEAHVPFRLEATTLRAGDHFTFETDAGDLDIIGVPAGTRGYEDLARTAETVELGGLRVAVTSLDDLIEMKRAAGRPKDRIELEVLGAVRDERRRLGET
jgi:Aminoglycoside-2''-adenylyltransferase